MSERDRFENPIAGRRVPLAMTRDTLLLELERTREELRGEREARRAEQELRVAKEAELQEKVSVPVILGPPIPETLGHPVSVGVGV